jgi:hypothetical protein
MHVFGDFAAEAAEQPALNGLQSCRRCRNASIATNFKFLPYSKVEKIEHKVSIFDFFEKST